MTPPTTERTGTIMDVGHVVIFMQENRSFDHYFGTLRGVRGFNDPHPLPLPGGKPVWQQPRQDGSGTDVLPFHLDSGHSNAQHMGELDHSWKGSQELWAHHDAWVPVKGELTMGYFTRDDLPFYYALADAFTIGDAYHASLFGPTNPNRMFLFTGTNGLTVGNHGPQAVDNRDDGNWTGDSTRDKPDFIPYDWTTYPERLQAAGISWKVYQEFDNYGDNQLSSFAAFRGLSPDHELHQRARAMVPGSHADNAAGTNADLLVEAFAKDVKNGTLPQVSWIVAPYRFCEHPDGPPGYGEALTARLLEALKANPEVWSKTVFILNYDENDGFFDHVQPPLPAITRDLGLSTVITAGEDYHGTPVGLGIRVPLLVASPWSRGGWVCSEVFDHTSIIRFLEARFGVHEPNISPWRRAICGDLTSVFDFAHPDFSWPAGLPSAAELIRRTDSSRELPPPMPPQHQSMPEQEPGERPARPLGYRLEVNGRTVANGQVFELELINSGRLGACFIVYRNGKTPRYYTVEAGKSLSDSWPIEPDGGRLVVHGPGGFVREFMAEIPTPADEPAL
jgi:phospholipase C